MGTCLAVRVVEMQQEILDQQQAEEAAEADGAGPMSNLPAPRASRKWVSRPYSA
jgi:exocyst complex component 3